MEFPRVDHCRLAKAKSLVSVLQPDRCGAYSWMPLSAYRTFHWWLLQTSERVYLLSELLPKSSLQTLRAMKKYSITGRRVFARRQHDCSSGTTNTCGSLAGTSTATSRLCPLWQFCPSAIRRSACYLFSSRDSQPQRTIPPLNHWEWFCNPQSEQFEGQ